MPCLVRRPRSPYPRRFCERSFVDPLPPAVKVPFSRPDDDDPVVRAGRRVFEREPGSDEPLDTATPAVADHPAPPGDPQPTPGQRGTRVLIGVALVAILAGAALVAIPALSGDDGDDAGALPESWPPDDDSRVLSLIHI